MRCRSRRSRRTQAKASEIECLKVCIPLFTWRRGASCGGRLIKINFNQFYHLTGSALRRACVSLLSRCLSIFPQLRSLEQTSCVYVSLIERCHDVRSGIIFMPVILASPTSIHYLQRTLLRKWPILAPVLASRFLRRHLASRRLCHLRLAIKYVPVYLPPGI